MADETPPFEIKWDGAEAGEQTLDPAKEGKATATFPNGDKYEGTYADGKRNGRGKYSWSPPKSAEEEEDQKSGTVYEGDFKGGKKHGEGVVKYEDGSEYRGEWKDGLKCGKGVYYYSNGDSYIGQWNKDLREEKEFIHFQSAGLHLLGNGKMVLPQNAGSIMAVSERSCQVKWCQEFGNWLMGLLTVDYPTYAL
eukprot:CAMPEP_0184503092 /NCGR_PEP_ID=MMETSP0113_2-20130426/51681_1 /TAXON_ID=91329 /ORGANISM="Norrisiella sphaerica, Strain BC52" /LENGTH=193 /DNA_ID=CAMNT_0026892513 /DNA_START=30 /DNA_END=612 /DNA_ORIENTATION=+